MMAWGAPNPDNRSPFQGGAEWTAGIVLDFGATGGGRL